MTLKAKVYATAKIKSVTKGRTPGANRFPPSLNTPGTPKSITKQANKMGLRSPRSGGWGLMRLAKAPDARSPRNSEPAQGKTPRPRPELLRVAVGSAPNTTLAWKYQSRRANLSAKLMGEVGLLARCWAAAAERRTPGSPEATANAGGSGRLKSGTSTRTSQEPWLGW